MTKNKPNTAERMQAILRGAFSGPPTPLKDIPTRSGEARKLGRNQPQKRSRKARKASAPKSA
jgi:hypothetical protein